MMPCVFFYAEAGARNKSARVFDATGDSPGFALLSLLVCECLAALTETSVTPVDTHTPRGEELSAGVLSAPTLFKCFYLFFFFLQHVCRMSVYTEGFLVVKFGCLSF